MNEHRSKQFYRSNLSSGTSIQGKLYLKVISVQGALSFSLSLQAGGFRQHTTSFSIVCSIKNIARLRSPRCTRERCFVHCSSNTKLAYVEISRESSCLFFFFTSFFHFLKRQHCESVRSNVRIRTFRATFVALQSCFLTILRYSVFRVHFSCTYSSCGDIFKNCVD